MLVLQPYIFREFPEIIFGFSTKSGSESEPPYYFNLSLSVGDNKEKVNKNRQIFFNSLELTMDQAAFQKQIHGDSILYVSAPGNIGESDSMITDKMNIGLCISTADCTSIFIYDPQKKIITGIHSGWRGTHKKITKKTLEKLTTDYGCDARNLFVYLGPSISRVNYEVGSEVADLFEPGYLEKRNNKLYLDVSKANYDMILNAGVPSYQIQQSSLCSFEYREVLHSYRRDGAKSGRALGVIAMRE